MIRRRVVRPSEKKDRRRGVPGVITAHVHRCVLSTIRFLLFGQRVCIPEFKIPP